MDGWENFFGHLFAEGWAGFLAGPGSIYGLSMHKFGVGVRSMKVELGLG